MLINIVDYCEVFILKIKTLDSLTSVHSVVRGQLEGRPTAPPTHQYALKSAALG